MGASKAATGSSGLYTRMSLQIASTPAGDDQPVQPGQLLRLAHLDRVRAEPAQHGRVLAKVALQRQNADAERSVISS